MSFQLDIIIPTLNESKNLVRLFTYLKVLHNIDRCQIWVVDSPLTNDNSKIICQNYNINYILSNRSSRASQMNLGSKSSNGTVKLFLHADVLPPEDFYAQIKSTIESKKEAGMFSYRFNSKKLLLKVNSYITRFNTKVSGGGDQCLFLSERAFNSLDGYNEDYTIMEDFELFTRIKEQNIPYAIINSDAIVSARKYKSNSYWRVNIINWIAYLKFKKKVAPIEIKEFYKKWIK